MSSRNFRGFFVLLILFAVACFAGSCGKAQSPAPQGAGRPSKSSAVASGDFTCLKGQQIPEFTLAAVDGRTVATSAFKGKKALLISFFATWCPHCFDEIPTLKQIQEEYRGKPFELLAVDLQEDRAAVEAFIRRSAVTYPVLLDSDFSVGRQYKVVGVPTNLVVDRSGKVVYCGNPLPDDWRAVIDPLVKE